MAPAAPISTGTGTIPWHRTPRKLTGLARALKIAEIYKRISGNPNALANPLFAIAQASLSRRLTVKLARRRGCENLPDLRRLAF